MSNVNPSFVVGTGRCGSTLLFKMLSAHPKVFYLTGLLDRTPNTFWINRALVMARHNRITRPFMMKRMPPSEAWTFWESHVPGFSNPCRDLRADDLTNVARAKIERLVGSMPSKKTPYMVIKFTGWTRVGLIKELYPKAPIVHLIRDPRAVVQSFLQVPWWDGWRGPSQWRWGELTPEEDRVWKGSGKSFVVLAAINWKRVMEAYWISKLGLPKDQANNVVECNYAELCERPIETIEFIRRHFGLPESELFIKRVKKHDVRTQDNKWMTAFTQGQVERLERALIDLDCGSLMVGPSHVAYESPVSPPV